MYSEKRFKREDGSEIMLKIDFHMGFNNIMVRLSLLVKAKGKRKFISPIDEDSYEYRRLPALQRHAFIINQMEQYLTPEEIQRAVKEEWERILPDYKQL